jgi:hypothetical protein
VPATLWHWAQGSPSPPSSSGGGSPVRFAPVHERTRVAVARMHRALWPGDRRREARVAPPVPERIRRGCGWVALVATVTLILAFVSTPGPRELG